MTRRSRRRFLAGGLAVGLGSLAGCLAFQQGQQCTDGLADHERDVDFPASTSWSSYQHDGANTGSTQSADGPAGDPTVAWRATTCGGTTGAVVASGRVLVGGLVFDARTGELVGGELHGHMSTPAVVDGTAYVSTHDVEAWDATSGEHLWTFETDVDSGGLPAPAVAGGTAYAPGAIDDPTLYAVDVADGTERWRFDLDATVEAPPAVADGTVYVADRSNKLYALDTATGDAHWTTPLDADIWLSGPVVDDGAVLLGSLAGEVLAVDTGDGSVRWRRAPGAEHFAVRDPVAVADGTAYVPGADGTIAAVDTADGEVAWHVDTDADVLGAPAVADGVVYVGARSSTPLFALAAATGEERWRFETRPDRTGDAPSSGIAVAPAVVGEYLYVATLAGDLYAIAGEQ